MRLPIFRRARAAALLVLATLSLPACRQAEQGETKVIVIGETPKIVDPAAGPLTRPQAVLLSNVAQGLVRFDPSGQIVPGLAERWNVSDDGLSYIFRLQSAEWPNGNKITAEQVARILRRQIAGRSKNLLKGSLGAVDEIVAMTDRVIEIRLKSARPDLLQLLAQPEFALVRNSSGSGPFRVSDDGNAETLGLVRTITDEDEETSIEEEVRLGGNPADEAVRAFLKGDVDLVLGGTFDDLPYARVDGVPKSALRFDPAAGLFGLVPARASGPAADLETRRLISQAIDRQALIDALNVPGLLPRATLLEPGLDGLAAPTPPEWAAIPIEERRAELTARANRLFGDLERPALRIALADSPGAKIMLNRIATDLGALGISVEAARPGQIADFKLIDAVAPSTSAAWYLRQFRCDEVPVCDEGADELLEGARAATVAAQRNALLAQAAQTMDEQQLFIALTAPIRWSLVSDRVQGFVTNRFAHHTLAALGQRPDRERAE